MKTFCIYHLPFTICHLPFAICHFGGNICHLPFTIWGKGTKLAALSILLLPFSVLTLPVQAEQNHVYPSPEGHGKVPDSLLTVELQNVSVHSTRASSKTPVAYTDMSQQQIKAVNYGQDIPFVLSLTPSVTTTSDAGNGIGYTSIRVRGTDPSRINITANGIPMNDAESGQLFWVNMGDFASSAQSMQIQRGVGTSTNGSGAFGATLNMLTENVGTKPFLGIDLSGGSYSSFKETVRFGTGLLGGHWGLQGRLSNISSNGYIDRAKTKLNSYFLQAGYFGDNTVVKFITFNGQEQTYHAWNYSSRWEQDTYGRRYNSCGEYYAPDGSTRYYDGQTDNYHQQNYQLLWTQQFSGNLSLNVGLHYTKGKGYYEEYKVGAYWADYGLATDNASGDLVRQQKMDNDFYGAVASLIYNNHDRLEAILGGGWNKYDGDNFGRVTWTGIPSEPTNVPALVPDFEYYRSNTKKTDFNVYGKATYTLTKGLNAYLDLQYRHVGLQMQNPTKLWGANASKKYILNPDYDFFNPKAGLTWDITPHHRLYASYAIAHKEPVRNNFMQQIANPGNASAVAKAERLDDLEVGYKFQSRHFSAGANIYWMNYKDQLVLTGELNEIGEALTRNLDRSYRLGIELEAAWQPADWFCWDVNATLSRNRVKDISVTLDDGTTQPLGDQPLSFSPSLILNNIFTFRYRGLKATVQTRYISEQYLTNTGFKTFTGWDADGNTTSESLMLDKNFQTNIDLSYTFSAKPIGMKDVTLGLTFYNIFCAEFDTNGWAAPAYTKTNGQVTAYNPNAGYGALRDCWAVGFAPSAPFHFMGHLSINF